MFKQSSGIGWDIARDDGLVIFTIDDPETLFSKMQELVDQETAIEVTSWAELATVGEEFEIRDLVIRVVDLRGRRW